MINRWGETLLELFETASCEVFMASPFIKSTVVDRIVKKIGPRVKFTCVTRWHPHEISAGVSDLEIWRSFRVRSNSSLWLVPNLHAKYYRADDQFSLGSANLTNSALGWSVRPNVELMMMGEVDPILRTWESGLLSKAMRVDSSTVQYFEELVKSLPANGNVVVDTFPEIEAPTDEFSELVSPDIEVWLPTTRYPEHVFKVYVGDTVNLSAGAIESATKDLLALAIPHGLDEARFKASVAANLVQMPLVRRVDDFLRIPRSFGAVRDFLKSLMPELRPTDPSIDWQTLMRWFRHYMPWRYVASVPNHSEVTIRVE